MFDTQVDRAMIEIIEKKNKLNALDYNDEQYDRLEDELHKIEDEFLAKYGSELEEVIADIHDEYCPDIDVLSPLSYIAREYNKVGENEIGSIYDVKANQGVTVDLDDFPDNETKLALIPNPMRVVLNIDNQQQEEIWSKEKSSWV
ncbi:hypothetical protein AAG747_17495 [Rapidithrix thailandica]|uniref:Uncharacterized protein n=1 Tax=Rapidithrix thailandica TaxID=413964 RepID=A0AAW9S0U5_9BACT